VKHQFLEMFALNLSSAFPYELISILNLSINRILAALLHSFVYLMVSCDGNKSFLNTGIHHSPVKHIWPNVDHVDYLKLANNNNNNNNNDN